MGPNIWPLMFFGLLGGMYVWMPYYYIQAKNNHPSFIISGFVIIWAEAQPELNTFPSTA